MILYPLTRRLERLIFSHRPWIVGLFMTLTVLLGYAATGLRIDAGFNKLLPIEHEYMQTFRAYRQEFGGANRILIALMVKQGDIFTPEFFATLEQATAEVFFIPGVDRAQVRSLFTPNVRFTEVVEEGIAGGNVVPSDFQNTPQDLEQVRSNVLKSDIIGRLVANDFSGAIISAELLEIDPHTGKRLDYMQVARQLEEKIRDRYQSAAISIHIIGFAKMVGDIAAGASRVVAFFGVTLLITMMLVCAYTRSFKLTLIPLVCSLIAVIWQLGLLPLLGFGMDPMSILAPFLVFAIAVSHGVQMISAHGAEVADGATSLEAARASFRRLLLPGGIALASDTMGFMTMLLIAIPIIRETAITASLGVAMIILTNLVLLPVLLSYLRYSEDYGQRFIARLHHRERVWRTLARVAEGRTASIMILIAIGLLGFGVWKGTGVAIGDLQRGVPELHPDSRYNSDARIISEHFAIGVDVLSVFVETIPNGCIDYEVMNTIDHFEWHMRNVEGVRSVTALSGVAKVIHAGWNEGSLKWRVLPRDPRVLAQSVAYVPTSSGLLNVDCSVMPVYIFTADHKAETLDRIISQVRQFREQSHSEKLKFRLAGGNVGIMAATNEVVKAAQFPMLLYVFSAIIVLCVIAFRSIRATLCIVIPLGLVSLLAYALMNLLEIGLKVNTLPVVALGVGVGVDYGIYIYSRLQGILAEGKPLPQAYRQTLMTTGSGVVLTGLTLAIGVATWIFSPLKFQADMGLLLTFMFLVNMLGAILLLPALAGWLLPSRHRNTYTSSFQR